MAERDVADAGSARAVAAWEPLAAYPDLLTADHMAEILEQSRRNVYRLAEKGQLPHVYVGRRVYFPKPLVIEALGLGELPCA